MKRSDYQAALRKRGRPVFIAWSVSTCAGTAGGALFLAQRLAEWSSWERHWVFLLMLPIFLLAILMGHAVAIRVDGKVGLKCTCARSLSYGRHVKALMQAGGCCPDCGRTVVEP